MLDCTKNYILENEFVLLRSLQNEDIQHLAHFAEEEPEIWRYSLLQIQNKNDLHHYITQATSARLQEKEYPFIVWDKIKKEYAGSTRFYDIQLPYKTLQLGYTWYGKKFQGTALNKNCKLLLLEMAFEQFDMERVEFRADNRNERSKAAMMSIGCTPEGVLRNHLPTIEGGRRDSIILSILREEWQSHIKQNLIHKINSQKAI